MKKLLIILFIMSIALCFAIPQVNAQNEFSDDSLPYEELWIFYKDIHFFMSELIRYDSIANVDENVKKFPEEIKEINELIECSIYLMCKEIKRICEGNICKGNEKIYEIKKEVYEKNNITKFSSLNTTHIRLNLMAMSTIKIYMHSVLSLEAAKNIIKDE